MNAESISTKSITTRNISIINRAPISDDEPLRIEINRKTKNTENGFLCLVTLSIFRESENDVKEKSFFVRQVIEGEFEYLTDDNVDKTTAPDQALTIIFPFLRAQVASMMSTIGLEPIILPAFIPEQ